MGILKKISRRLSKQPRCTAVIVAAGSASRMQGVDKVLADLGGKPVLLHTLLAFQQCGAVDEIVVVTRKDLLGPVGSLCRASEISKVRNIVAGGAERSASVLAGLEYASARATLAAIHDGARPLAAPVLIEAVIGKAAQTGAAAPAVPVKDTVKIVQDGVVVETPDRGVLAAVQTPQVFDIDLLRAALYKASQDGAVLTDDCAAVERIGMKVHLVEGSDENLKITTPLDLAVARSILEGRRAP